MEPQNILLPLTKDYLKWSLQNSDTLQWALLNFSCLISSNFPRHKLFSLHQVEELPWLSKQPVEGLMVFTDASGKTPRTGLTWQNKGKWLREILEGPGDSLQILELPAVIIV